MATITLIYDHKDGAWIVDCQDCWWAYATVFSDEARQAAERHQRLHGGPL